jgi:hypothetical protein
MIIADQHVVGRIEIDPAAGIALRRRDVHIPRPG